MAESLVERILASVKTDLEAIEADGGTTYWNTFDKVTRCDVFHRDLLVAQYDTIALIRDTGDDRPIPDAFGVELRELDVWIQIHTRDLRGEKDPHRATTGSGTLRDRLIQDIATKMLADITRNSLAYTTLREAELRDLDAPAGWIGAEVLYVVRYQHDLGSP